MGEGTPVARRPRRRLKRRWARLLGFLLLVLLGGALYGGSLAYKLLWGIQARDDPGVPVGLQAARQPLTPDQPLHILLMGIDEGLVEGGGRVRVDARRTDAMVLLTVDRLSGHIGLLWLPRDSRVQIPERAVQKLTQQRGRNPVQQNPTKLGHVHAYGGPALAVATVSELLDVPVQRYVRLDLAGFARLVDLIGGVEMDVEKPLRLADPYQDLYINIRPGPQLLDGQTALKYVRFRGDESDLDRIARQQKFAHALVDQALNLNLLTRLPALVDTVADNVTTDLLGGEMLTLARWLAGQARTFSKEQLVTGTLPGTPGYIGGGSFWLVDQEALSAELDRVIWGLDYAANGNLRVVLYDTFGTDLAARLSQWGYQVDVLGTTGPTPRVRAPQQTQVLDHGPGEGVPAQLLARHVVRLVPTAQFFRRPLPPGEGQPAVDVSIIVGSDYSKQQRVFQTSPAAVKGRGF